MATGRRTLRPLLAALVALAGVAHGQARSPLVVTLTAPRGGVHDGGFSAIVEGTVSDRSVRRAWLTANGLTREVPVTDGRVRESVLALPGVNRVALAATHGGDLGRDAVTFYARGIAAELVVWVTWRAEDDRVRFEVSDRAWEFCRLANACNDRSECANRPFRDCDRTLVGPCGHAPSHGSRSRVASLPRVDAPWLGIVIRSVHGGRYTIRSPNPVYGSDLQRRRGAIDSLLSQLDVPYLPTTPAQHAALLAELDRAAAPLPTATPVRALAVLFPGTPQERRWIFDGTLSLYRPGSPLGEIDITEAELRAVRGVPQ